MKALDAGGRGREAPSYDEGLPIDRIRPWGTNLCGAVGEGHHKVRSYFPARLEVRLKTLPPPHSRPIAMGNSFSASNKRGTRRDRPLPPSFILSPEPPVQGTPESGRRLHKKAERERHPTRNKRSRPTTTSSTSTCTSSPSTSTGTPTEESSATPSKKQRVRSSEKKNYYTNAKGKKFRRIPAACLCGNVECVAIWRRFVDIGDGRRCGYWRVPAAARQVVCFHLHGNMSPVPKGPRRGHEEFVHFHHFNPAVLRDGNEGPLDRVIPNLATALGYTDHDKMESGSYYWPAPNYSLKLAERDVRSVEIGRNLRSAIVEGREFRSYERLSPEDRRIQSVHREMQANLGKMTLEYCMLKQRVEELELKLRSESKNNAALQLDLIRLKEEMETQKDIDDSGGLSRESITCKNWHGSRQSTAHFLFGLGTFENAVVYVTEVFFPEVDYKAGKNKEPLTDFEQILAFLLKVHRSYDDETVRIIFHRTGHSFMTDVMNKWRPRFSELGLFMSILDLDFTMDCVSPEYAREHGLPHYSVDDSPRDRYESY